jgi:hypothetical protein
VFANPTVQNTLATFASPGSYVLRLTASDGALTASADTTVIVESPVPAGAVVINPGDDIQTAVNNTATGTTFFLRAGVYQLQSIEPKDNDTFIGELGAVLSGARQLSVIWDGNYWVALGQTQQQMEKTGVCRQSSPRCNYAEDLFLDDVALQQVSSLAQVTSGKWFFDYSAGKIYMWDNPTGRKVETSVAAHAFFGNEANVTIQNLVIEKYANPAQSGAIHGAFVGPGPRSTGWVIKNCTVRLNHGSGIWLGEAMQVLNNLVHHNGQIGVSGGGSSILVDSNEIAYNNNAGYDWSWEAGGTKFVGTTNLIVRGNYVHDNDGPGLWTDINNTGTLYENNRTVANKVAGILHEISFSAVIRNNTVESDGFTPDGSSFLFGAGILVSDSNDVEIYGNTVSNCMNGIGAIHANRGSPYLVQNLYVHDNLITQSSGLAAGIVRSAVSDTTVFTSLNNRLQGNTYKLGADAKYYDWMGAARSRYEWQGYGLDTTGTWY